mgnify:CR=1 FL=1
MIISQGFSLSHQVMTYGLQRFFYEQGLSYEEGRGVERDLEEAARCFLEAAGKGHIQAQYKIGYMHKYKYYFIKPLTSPSSFKLLKVCIMRMVMVW